MPPCPAAIARRRFRPFDCGRNCSSPIARADGCPRFGSLLASAGSPRCLCPGAHHRPAPLRFRQTVGAMQRKPRCRLRAKAPRGGCPLRQALPGRALHAGAGSPRCYSTRVPFMAAASGPAHHFFHRYFMQRGAACGKGGDIGDGSLGDAGQRLARKEGLMACDEHVGKG
jgi:hypothetical protein